MEHPMQVEWQKQMPPRLVYQASLPTESAHPKEKLRIQAEVGKNASRKQASIQELHSQSPTVKFPLSLANFKSQGSVKHRTERVMKISGACLALAMKAPILGIVVRWINCPSGIKVVHRWQNFLWLRFLAVLRNKVGMHLQKSICTMTVVLWVVYLLCTVDLFGEITVKTTHERCGPFSLVALSHEVHTVSVLKDLLSLKQCKTWLN